MIGHRPRGVRPCLPRFEVLEGRIFLAQFGVAWHHADHLTLSFVPPTLARTIRRTVWCRKVCACPGIAGWAAVDQVPIHLSSA